MSQALAGMVALATALAVAPNSTGLLELVNANGRTNPGEPTAAIP